MYKDLINKIDYYLLFFILTIILCFGFFLSNSSMGIDDEMLDWYGSLYSAVSIGRLGRIFQYIIGYEYIPFFYDFIAILLYSFSIFISVDCFMKYINNFTKKQAVIFSCIAVSFPFTAFLFAFMIVTVHIGTALFASSIASHLFCKYLFDNVSKKYLFYSILCLIFSISLYETSVIYFLISITFIAFINNNKNRQFSFKIFAFGLLTGIISVYSYLLILKSTKFLMDINSDRSTEFVNYNFNSFKLFFYSLFEGIKELWNNYLQTIQYDFGSFMILLSIILFILITLYLSITRKSIITFMIGIILLTLPLGTFFLTGNGELYYRVYSPFGYFIAVTFSLLSNFTLNKKILSFIFTFLTVFIVLNQAKEINRIYYTEHLKFQEDLTFAKFIMHDLGQNKLEHKPVVFAGKKDEIRLKYNYDVEAPEITVSIFNWDKYNSNESELFVRRSYNFMHHYGLKIIPFEDYSPEIVQTIAKTVQKMPVYPNNGYIKDMGDFVIVKIGKSVWDK